MRTHNRVVLGAVLHNPDNPAWFLPISRRLYFGMSDLPETKILGRTESSAPGASWPSS